MATERERQLAGELFGAGKEAQSMGVMDVLKETANIVAPGLKDLIPEAKAQLTHMAAHGAHELAAALFNGNQGGNAFVMYPRSTGKDDPAREQNQHQGHGVHGPEAQREQPQQERGGLSL